MNHKNLYKPSRSIEHRYRRAIGRLLFALSEKLKTASTADEALSIIRHFARSPTFKQAVYKIVKAMVTQVAAGNQKSWRAVAAKGSREHRFNLLLYSKKQL